MLKLLHITHVANRMASTLQRLDGLVAKAACCPLRPLICPSMLEASLEMQRLGSSGGVPHPNDRAPYWVAAKQRVLLP